jgi:hypothetical protein
VVGVNMVVMMSSGGPIKRYQQLVDTGKLREDSHQKGTLAPLPLHRGEERLICSCCGGTTETVSGFTRLQTQRPLGPGCSTRFWIARTYLRFRPNTPVDFSRGHSSLSWKWVVMVVDELVQFPRTE